MPRIISAYYLALSAGNAAFLAFAWSKFAAPVAVPLRRQQGQFLTSIMGLRRISVGPVPQGGHAARY